MIMIATAATATVLREKLRERLMRGATTTSMLVAEESPWRREGTILKQEVVLSATDGRHRLPLVVSRPPESEKIGRDFPVVILVHCTASWRHDMRDQMEALASYGSAAIAFDLPYFGDRHPTLSADAYRQANRTERSAFYISQLVKVARGELDEAPFLYDGARDCLAVVDYASRQFGEGKIGAAGVSLGGMVVWLAAAAEPKISVVAPLIGFQWFDWAAKNDNFHGRVASLSPLFETMAKTDLGKAEVDSETFVRVLDRITPGLRTEFDAPFSLGLVAPRHFLIVTGQNDPRCPLQGISDAYLDALQNSPYRHHPANLKLYVEPDVAHNATATMWSFVHNWFRIHLIQDGEAVTSIELEQDRHLRYVFGCHEDHLRAARDYLGKGDR